jgi:hypothetical protein
MISTNYGKKFHLGVVVHLKLNSSEEKISWREVQATSSLPTNTLSTHKKLLEVPFVKNWKYNGISLVVKREIEIPFHHCVRENHIFFPSK